MTTAEEEDPLSLEQNSNFDELLRLKRSGQVRLQKDARGKLCIIYINEGTEKGPKGSDVRTQIEEFVEKSKSVKRAKSSLGLSVVLDESKIMLKEFSGDEVLSWLDLSDSDTFPSLYMVRLNEDKVSFHMEIIKHGVTLSGIIEDSLLLTKDPKLMWPFSVCIFYKLLRAVKEMHGKNWAHCDLHGGNVLITKDTLMLKVLDFGKAQKLRRSKFDAAAMKDDILKALRLFCSVYTGKEFMDINAMEEMIVKETLMKEMLSDTPHMRDEEKGELEELIMKTYNAIRYPNQAGYGSTTSVMEQIQNKIYHDKMDVLKQAAAHLFPDFYKDFGLHAGPEAQDTHTRAEADEATGLHADFSTSLEDAVAVPALDEAEEIAGDTHTRPEADEATGLHVDFSTSLEDAVAVRALDEAEEIAGDTHTQDKAGEMAGDTLTQDKLEKWQVRPRMRLEKHQVTPTPRMRLEKWQVTPTTAREMAGDTHTQDKAGEMAGDTHTQDEAGKTSGDTHTQDKAGEMAGDAQDGAGETAGDTHTQDESDAIDADFKGLNIRR